MPSFAHKSSECHLLYTITTNGRFPSRATLHTVEMFSPILSLPPKTLRSAGILPALPPFI
ncbi:MAG: hypothetical protein M5U34_11080 [Chloroflexi bacterium]|nr:hypothetical protein [Chloroflexota bacterium]